jgi:hypothetical protein
MFIILNILINSCYISPKKKRKEKLTYRQGVLMNPMPMEGLLCIWPFPTSARLVYPAALWGRNVGALHTSRISVTPPPHICLQRAWAACWLSHQHHAKPASPQPLHELIANTFASLAKVSQARPGSAELPCWPILVGYGSHEYRKPQNNGTVSHSKGLWIYPRRLLQSLEGPVLLSQVPKHFP